MNCGEFLCGNCLFLKIWGRFLSFKMLLWMNGLIIGSVMICVINL